MYVQCLYNSSPPKLVHLKCNMWENEHFSKDADGKNLETHTQRRAMTQGRFCCMSCLFIL